MFIALELIPSLNFLIIYIRTDNFAVLFEHSFFSKLYLLRIALTEIFVILKK